MFSKEPERAIKRGNVSNHRRTGNSFLDSLPEETRAILLPSLEEGPAHQGQVLSRPNEPFTDVAFPIQSVISTVIATVEGSTVEVALIGHEGLAPLPIVFGSRVSRHGTMVQVPDSALFMGAHAFLAAYHADIELRNHCARYAEYSFDAAMQFAACNAVHPVEERYARWLLMTSDRVGSTEFSLTQEYSAQMLGVRRATVTNIALGLAKSNLISYRRGHVSVVDRDALEEVACECYAAVNRDLENVMGYRAQRPSPTNVPSCGARREGPSVRHIYTASRHVASGKS